MVMMIMVMVIVMVTITVLIVNWCFKPSQPQRIKSGLIFIKKETFIKENVAEKTSKAEIRREEQNGKAESCRETLWTEIQLKGP